MFYSELFTKTLANAYTKIDYGMYNKQQLVLHCIYSKGYLATLIVGFGISTCNY